MKLSRKIGLICIASVISGALGLTVSPLGQSLKQRYIDNHPMIQNAHAWPSHAISWAGVRVESVELLGRENAALIDVMQALAVKRGTAMHMVDIENARQRVETLGWVASAKIDRLWPNRLKLIIEERQPAAVWQKDGHFTLIDMQGEIITHDVTAWSHLPHVVGLDADKNLPEIIALLDTEPELAELVLSAVRVGTRRWDIALKNAVTIQLPEQNPIAAWLQFADLVRTQGLLDRDITLVDLRLDDRVGVRLTEQGLEKWRARGPHS